MALLILALFISLVQGKKLWSLQNNYQLHLERRLSGRPYKNPRFHELQEPLLFSIDSEHIDSLQPGDSIIFDVTDQNGNVLEKECSLNAGILGIPDSTVIKAFSCSLGNFEELQLIINPEKTNGLSGTIFHEDGSSLYISSAFENDNVYIMYDLHKFLHQASAPPHVHTVEDATDSLHRSLRQSRNLQISSTDVIQYTLAILTSQEFSSLHGSTLSSVSAFITQVIARVNGIYLREVGIFWNLVSNFENGICLPSSTDAVCTAVPNNSVFRDDTLGHLENLGIPPESYDAGHLLFSQRGAGGVAQLKSICKNNNSGNNKARAASNSASPFTNDVDGFTVLMFAHELAHQIGAGHTFRDCINHNTGGNLNEATAVEPGSGSTLMSFGGGICGGATNIVQTRDAYLHAATRKELRDEAEKAFEGRSCGTRRALNLPAGTVETPDVCNVPIGNTFLLAGSSTSNSNSRFYSWERIDNGIEKYDDERLGRFRSYEPVQNRVERFFPNLHYQNFIQDRDFEILPTVARSMTFRFSERSNFDASASQSSLNTGVVSAFTTSDTVVNFVGSQKFSITEPSDSVQIPVDKGFELKWNPGSLGELSPDQNAQVFFAENTMSEITLANLIRIDYRTDIDELNWIKIADTTVVSGGICTSIPSNIVNSNNLEGITGNILIKISTNQAGNGGINDASNCFVTALLKDVTLINDPNVEDSCVIGTVFDAPANSSGGLSPGGTVFLVFFFIALFGFAGFFVYKKKFKEEKDFNDAASMNSRKPRATPIPSNQRWSNKRINLDAPQTGEETFKERWKAYASTKLAKSKETFERVKTSIKDRVGATSKTDPSDAAVEEIRSIRSVGIQRPSKTRNIVDEPEDEAPIKKKHLSASMVFGAFRAQWQGNRSKNNDVANKNSDTSKPPPFNFKPKSKRIEEPTATEKKEPFSRFKNVGKAVTAAKFFKRDEANNSISTKQDVANKKTAKEGGAKSKSRQEAEKKAFANRYPFDAISSGSIFKKPTKAFKASSDAKESPKSTKKYNNSNKSAEKKDMKKNNNSTTSTPVRNPTVSALKARFERKNRNSLSY